MASTGTIINGILSNAYQLRVRWTQTPNVTANTSKITCTMYLVQKSGWSLNISARSGNTTTINGVKYTWSSPAINKSGGTTTLAQVVSEPFPHNADGSKTISISSTFNIQATISGAYYSSITVSSTIALEDIPRATTPTVRDTSVDMGGSITINTPRASSGFLHDLAYSFAGSGYTTFATNVVESYEWTVPDLASKIPNSNQGTITIRCNTKKSGALIGTKTCKFTAKVPSSVVPTISAVATTETADGIAAQFGAFVQNKSEIEATITAAGAKGSTIKSYSTTFQGKTYTGSTVTLAKPSTTGSLSIVTKVTDSRGRTASKTTKITVLAYSAPKISKLTAYRIDSSGTAQDDGLHTMLSYAYSVATVGNKNTAAMKIEWKKSTDTSWNSTPLMSSSALSGSATTKITSQTFSTDNQYDFRISVTDWFGATATYTATLPTGAVILDIAADGKGIGFGKVSETNGIDFGWPIVGQTAAPGSMYGQYKAHDGLLIQWGSVTITPEAAGTPTNAVVTFPIPFTAVPAVFATPVSSVPQNISVSVQRSAELVTDNKLAMVVTLVRNGLTATGVNWLAIGKG